MSWVLGQTESCKIFNTNQMSNVINKIQNFPQLRHISQHVLSKVISNHEEFAASEETECMCLRRTESPSIPLLPEGMHAK